jgi:hypothetical protein
VPSCLETFPEQLGWTGGRYIALFALVRFGAHDMVWQLRGRSGGLHVFLDFGCSVAWVGECRLCAAAFLHLARWLDLDLCLGFWERIRCGSEFQTSSKELVVLCDFEWTSLAGWGGITSGARREWHLDFWNCQPFGSEYEGGSSRSHGLTCLDLE